MRPGSLLRKIALRPFLNHLSIEKSIGLDLGGFDGLLSRTVMWRNPRQIIVIDLDMTGLREAQTHGLQSLQASASGLPISDACIDWVLCLDLIEHVQDDHHILKEIGRILRPGGKVILTTPCVEFRLPFITRAKINETWGHVRNGYSNREIEILFEQADIKLIQHEYYFNAFSRFFYSIFFLRPPFRGTNIKLGVFQRLAVLEHWFHLGAQEHIVVGIKPLEPIRME